MEEVDPSAMSPDSMGCVMGSNKLNQAINCLFCYQELTKFHDKEYSNETGRKFRGQKLLQVKKKKQKVSLVPFLSSLNQNFQKAWRKNGQY